jgi:hypothetical protein
MRELRHRPSFVAGLFCTSFLHISLLSINLFLFLFLYNMAPSKLVVFANLALAASAILIPSMSLGDDHALATLVINPSQRTALLECPGCAFATAEGESQSLKWKAGAGNAFVSFPTRHHSLVC